MSDGTDAKPTALERAEIAASAVWQDTYLGRNLPAAIDAARAAEEESP